MKFFVASLPAPLNSSMKFRVVSLAVATILVVMAVAQLFKYEDFPAVLDGLWQSNDAAAVHLLAASIVVCEVFALPFLLWMRLSPLMRLASMLCGWFAAGIWVIIAFWRAGVSGEAVNQGLLGATVPITSEWLMILFTLALAFGVGYVSYVSFKLPKR